MVVRHDRCRVMLWSGQSGARFSDRLAVALVSLPLRLLQATYEPLCLSVPPPSQKTVEAARSAVVLRSQRAFGRNKSEIVRLQSCRILFSTTTILRQAKALAAFRDGCEQP